MKKFFTLFIMLAVTMLSYGQTGNQLWWGYVNGSEKTSGLGVQKADVYHCAIFIPGNHGIAGGKTIRSVRFGLVAPNATNCKVWLASSLPATVDKNSTLQMADVAATELGKQQIEVALPTAYAIPAEGVYVGYSFTISDVVYQADAYPILIAGTDQPNSLLIKTDNLVPEWSDMYGSGYGALYMQVLLEGEFADNTATPSITGEYYAQLGGSTQVDVSLLNNGASPLTSIDYTITTDGVAGAEQHLELESPIAFNNSGRATFEVAADAEAGSKTKTLTVTKVNGQANNAPVTTSDFTLITLEKLIARNVAVEQFTGTGCGWCPRGHVGMAKMREAFGDRFIGIAIHQYSNQSSDAMYLAPSKYANHGLNGAPSCRLNRGESMDPYYGSGEDVLYDMQQALAVPALAEVSVSGVMDTNKTKIDAKATLTPLIAGNYTLEFVAVADGLTGTGTGWQQTNYYSSQYASQTGITKSSLPEDLQYLFDLRSTFTGTFNDVAIASSYVSSKNQVEKLTLTANEEQEVSYTITMPTYTKLKNALKDDQIYVVALLVDAQGKIVQAAKQQVSIADPTGIEDVKSMADAQPTDVYTLDGRKSSNAQRGLQIVRLSDGRTVKVVK
jgi:hypothetical protein